MKLDCVTTDCFNAPEAESKYCGYCEAGVEPQVGGADDDHYSCLAIQPREIINANWEHMRWDDAVALKYLMRFRRKGQGPRDLRQVIACCEKLLADEFPGE